MCPSRAGLCFAVWDRHPRLRYHLSGRLHRRTWLYSRRLFRHGHVIWLREGWISMGLREWVKGDGRRSRPCNAEHTMQVRLTCHDKRFLCVVRDYQWRCWDRLVVQSAAFSSTI
jgi:hypothetical protein